MFETILLIDDEVRLASALKQRLEAFNYRVNIAACAATALVAVNRFPPHLILLDISMPGMDGFDLCRLFRSNPQLNDTPILAVSALAHESSRRAILEAGADLFIAKPYELKHLLDVVRHNLNGRASLQAPPQPDPMLEPRAG